MLLSCRTTIWLLILTLKKFAWEVVTKIPWLMCSLLSTKNGCDTHIMKISTPWVAQWDQKDTCIRPVCSMFYRLKYTSPSPEILQFLIQWKPAALHIRHLLKFTLWSPRFWSNLLKIKNKCDVMFWKKEHDFGNMPPEPQWFFEMYNIHRSQRFTRREEMGKLMVVHTYICSNKREISDRITFHWVNSQVSSCQHLSLVRLIMNKINESFWNERSMWFISSLKITK